MKIIMFAPFYFFHGWAREIFEIDSSIDITIRQYIIGVIKDN